MNVLLIPNGGLDVTTVVDPDKGAKVRGLFESFSFHVSEERKVTFYENVLPVVDHSIKATPKATDDQILDACLKYLRSTKEPVAQRQLVQHTADVTGAGEKKVRRLIAQNSELSNPETYSGKPIVYTIGQKNSHYYEVSKWLQRTVF